MDPHLAQRTDWDALAAAFGALGALHRQPPTAPVLESVRQLVDEWPLPETAGAHRGTEEWRASAAAGEDPETIARDHARLYGTAALARVAPYESVHRGADGLVFDAETLQVRQLYRTLGLSLPQVGREPDDHIGLEFDFMAQALDHAAQVEDPDAALVAARRMLDEHLLQWAPDMLTAAASEAETHFLAGVAWLSLGTLTSAAEVLGSAGYDPAPSSR